MQLQLPLFPAGTHMISDRLGFYVNDDIVQYIINGLPAYAHSNSDHQSFRFITSNFIEMGLCTQAQVQRAFHVSITNVSRAYKLFKEKGSEGFFGADRRHGNAHKILGERKERIQKKLDEGKSISGIAREEGVAEGGIRYHIKQGSLKKKPLEQQTSVIREEAATPNERNEQDQQSPLGIAATRYEQRAAAMLGLLNEAPVRFEPNEAVDNAGVLFLLPALLAQGLLQIKEVYQYPKTGYYSPESIILTLALMALMRIKNPEQLKNCRPGEIGRIIGLDRIPETKCLRRKIDAFSRQEQSWELNKRLIDQWYKQDEQQNEQQELFFYIDGHVRIYYGDAANLPAKYVSRQKLCLSATTEFWVNDDEGLPVMVVIGELTEKLQTIIEYTIIPKLIEAGSVKNIDPDNPPPMPQCTFVFDREAYHPAFFIRLWEQYRIAIITYRKFVKDKWDAMLFQSNEVQVLHNKTTMLLYEQQATIDNHPFREIRRLTASDHQTSILTTHPFLAMVIIAGKMFGRWVQENFFRYLIADYDFDKLIQYEVRPIDENKEVVNPQHRRLSYALKKLREKISRQKAYFYPLAEKTMDKTLDDIEDLYKQQAHHAEQLKLMQQQEQELVSQLKDVPNRIKLSQMPSESRYNKLHAESKLFMNIIKMICYRAETAFADILQEYLSRATEEKRMLVKQIINTTADLFPDYENKKLVIVLHSLSAPRFNAAVQKIIPLLNDTQTIFPGTDLTLVFKTTSI